MSFKMQKRAHREIRIIIPEYSPQDEEIDTASMEKGFKGLVSATMKKDKKTKARGKASTKFGSQAVKNIKNDGKYEA